MELLKAMKESIYQLLEKKGGLSKLNIAILNEHRRKKRHLPPLTAIDYNCMDRASLKLKMVLDTLNIVRRISGLSLKPRNLALLRRLRDYSDKRRGLYIDIVTQQARLSIRLMLMWGPSVEIDPKINPASMMIQASGPHIQSKSMEKQRKENIEKIRAERMNLAGLNESDPVINIGEPAGTGIMLSKIHSSSPQQSSLKQSKSPLKGALKKSSMMQRHSSKVMFDLLPVTSAQRKNESNVSLGDFADIDNILLEN